MGVEAWGRVSRCLSVEFSILTKDSATTLRNIENSRHIFLDLVQILSSPAFLPRSQETRSHGRRKSLINMGRCTSKKKYGRTNFRDLSMINLLLVVLSLDLLVCLSAIRTLAFTKTAQKHI